MRGADPDALWRPGFTGSWGYTARVLPRTRRRRPLAVGAGVALLAAAATAAVGLADRGADGSGGFPTGAAHRWSVELAGLEVGHVTRGDDMVVLADTHGSRVVALGARDGTPRWEGRLPKGFVADLQVTEPAVLAVVRERVGSEVLVALDAVDGSPRWSEELAGARVVTVGSSGIILERMARETRGLELLDAATGRVIAAVSGDDIAWTRTHVRRRDGDRLDLFDPASFAADRSIDLAPLGLGGRSVDGVVVRGGTVVAADDRAVLVDEHGAARDSVALEAPGRPFPVDVHALDPAGSFVAVQAGYRVTVLSAGDRLQVLWSERAWLVDWQLDADTRLVAVAGLSGTIVAFPPRLLDASTGETRWDGPAEVLGASARRVFADGGFIGLIGARGQDQMVVGYDLEGVERWRRPLDNGERAVLVDGGLVTVTNRSEGATVSLSS